MTPLFPAAYHVIPLIEFGQQRRYFFGVVLQVGVHGDNDVPVRQGESGGQGACLAEIAAQPDNVHDAVSFAQGAQDIPGAVGAAVVDEQNAVGVAADVFMNALRQPLQRGRFVIYGDDKCNHGNRQFNEFENSRPFPTCRNYSP